MKKILISLMAILLAVGLVGGGALAYFSDVETSEDNVFTAGTLNLQVGDDDPCTEQITVPNVEPGFYKSLVYKVKNTGTLDGNLSIGFSEIINNDNGLTEPEKDAGDTTGGDGQGELGRALCVKMMRTNPDPDAIIFYWMRLNGWGGVTQTTAGGNPMILHAGEEWDIRLEFKLGANQGNVIQSDSVEFDIIFHLDQVTP